MQRIKDLLRKWRTPRPPRVGQLQIGGDSFVYSNADGSSEVVEWSDVARIFTYKVDCYIYDDIWLAFERKSGAAVYVAEDAAGFMELGTAMIAHFPGVPETWFSDVMQPPFAENFTMPVDNTARSGDVDHPSPQ